MKMMRAAVVVVIVLAAAMSGAAGRAEAVEPTGTKVLKRDCTLQMESKKDHATIPLFLVKDVGDGCGNYLIVGVSIVDGTGFYGVRTLAQGFDENPDPYHEQLASYGTNGGGFRSGNVTVYAPYRARCDRYRMDSTGTVSFLDSWPCHGSAFPPGVKAFLKDCSLNTRFNYERDWVVSFAAYDHGSECDAYELEGISITMTDGGHAFSSVDSAADPDIEDLSVLSSGFSPADFSFGDVSVHIPYRARCDRYRVGHDLVVRYLDSWTCSGT